MSLAELIATLTALDVPSGSPVFCSAEETVAAFEVTGVGTGTAFLPDGQAIVWLRVRSAWPPRDAGQEEKGDEPT